MSIAQDIFCFVIPLMMMSAAVLLVDNGVGGCWWPISARTALMDFAFWQFSTNSPNVNLTLSTNHPVYPCAPAKGSAHAYTQKCARIHR